MALTRKLTISTVAGKKAAWFEKLMALQPNDKGEKRLELCVIMGFANSGKPDATEMGEFIKFAGSFEGINSQTGEVFTSGLCILPNFYAEQLFAAVQTPGRVAPVKFAVKVGVIYDPESVTSYQYVLDHAAASAADDAMAQLRAEVTGKPLIAAPKATAAPAPAAAAKAITKK